MGSTERTRFRRLQRDRFGLASGWRLAALSALAFALPVCAPAFAQEEPTAAPAVGAPQGPRVLAQFTTGVENREPIDQVSFVENEASKIFFFTDLRGLEGKTVVHRWIYDGNVEAEVSFDVRGPRWRVWSSKDLLPDWIGDWTVEIVVVAEPGDDDADGGEDQDLVAESTDTTDEEVIAAETFTYSAPTS